MRVATAALVLALVAAACGGGDDNGEASPNEAKQRAVITISTTAGNAAREQAEQILQSQLAAAGFELKIKNADADTLFGKWLPAGNFGMALYGLTGTPDPDLCALFCSSSIPSEKNGGAGMNFTRTGIPALDEALEAQRTAVDPAERARLVKKATGLLADSNDAMPLYRFPTVLAYNGGVLSGPIHDNTVAGPFVNAHEWEVAGGDAIVAAAEQEPECTDWIASCAGSAWGNWILRVQTAPSAFDVDSEGRYVPGAILAGEPTVTPAGEGMTITYPISPEAVWDDGSPVTSTDFKYLWQQITESDDVLDRTGYDQITAVDDGDPKKAVVTLESHYAPWRDLFGGFYGLYPSHLLEGHDRSAATKDGYQWSAGPWKLESWKKGESLTLVPNPNWWGAAPKADKLVFRFITDTAAEVQAYKTNQVQVMYPTPQVGLVEDLQKVAGTKVAVGFGNVFEGLWFNTSRAPLDRAKVRQAIGYAVERDAVVKAVVTPSIEPLAAGEVLDNFVMPTFRDFYTPAWGQYRPDLDKVAELMEADGWTRGSDGIWERERG